MRISDWSSDVCSSDLLESGPHALVERSRDFTLVPWRDVLERHVGKSASGIIQAAGISWTFGRARGGPALSCCCWPAGVSARADDPERQVLGSESRRSEEHTSELQSLIRISYDVFCLNKKYQ